MIYPDAKTFELLWAAAAAQCDARLPGFEDQLKRIELWRRQEFHNWLRWRICRKGFDWSKPGVLALNAAGFAALVIYGFKSGNFFVTAGGIVAWFTLVNLAFFTYFGLTLPGPPSALPELLQKSGADFQAEMGLYPAGYERRKLPRVWLRLKDHAGAPLAWELAFEALPAPLKKLATGQMHWRMQRGDAPLTRAVVRGTGATRAQLDFGEKPFEIAAFEWNEQALVPFKRF